MTHVACDWHRTHAPRLAQYEQLWSLKFPNGSLGSASSGETHPVEDLLRFSTSSQISNPEPTHMVNNTGHPSSGHLPHLDAPPSTSTNTASTSHPGSWQTQEWSVQDGVQGFIPDVAPPPVTNEATSYPPTRPASPQDLSLREVYEPHTSSHTPEQEWREPDAAENDAASWNPGMLDGMGATQLTFEGKKAGAGYIGLSSSATLLLAIRRLVAKRSASSVTDDWIGTMTLETWADQPSATSSEDVTPTPFPRFPPARETTPLVDSYFTYFRKLLPPFNISSTKLSFRYTYPSCSRANSSSSIDWGCASQTNYWNTSLVLHDLRDGRRRHGQYP